MREPFFPMNVKTLVVTMCSGLTLVFLAVFFLTTPPFEYNYDETVTVEVVNVYETASSTTRGRSNTKIKLQIRFEDGVLKVVSIPMTSDIKKGEFIELDIYHADGEKPRYQLAQPAVQP